MYSSTMDVCLDMNRSCTIDCKKELQWKLRQCYFAKTSNRQTARRWITYLHRKVEVDMRYQSGLLPRLFFVEYVCLTFIIIIIYLCLQWYVMPYLHSLDHNPQILCTLSFAILNTFCTHYFCLIGLLLLKITTHPHLGEDPPPGLL